MKPLLPLGAPARVHFQGLQGCVKPPAAQGLHDTQKRRDETHVDGVNARLRRPLGVRPDVMVAGIWTGRRSGELEPKF